LSQPGTERPALQGDVTELADLAEEIVPALIARLRASRLAELEVRSAGWRIRLRRDLTASRPQPSAALGVSAAAVSEDEAVGVARSPAVGYFSPGELLVVGRSVVVGDSLGSVDVLGIAQEVSAPVSGILGVVLAEAGQAVEYGQALAEIVSLEPEAKAAEGGAEGATTAPREGEMSRADSVATAAQA